MLSILIVAGLVLVAVIAYGERQFRAPGPLEAETTVVIPRGAGLREASERLEEAGAVADAMLFRLGANYSGAATRLRFGEYRIEAGASMASILDQLVSGDTVSYRVTVAEGLSSWEVVEILRASEVLEGEIEAVPAEGSLAPDTYFVSRGDTRTDVIRRMEAAQTAILAEAWEARAADLPLASPEEVLVLASIVEKETGVASERPQVASVFVNRLRRGMPLQSDPTVIYGITEGKGPLGRGIRASELRARTPWNTYVIPALPPTPIANPGRDAIRAVVNPLSTTFFYFVADGTGGHAFAETLTEHNRNVARWREIERARSNNQ